jgi:ABC-type transporter Mla subunit MlaD
VAEITIRISDKILKLCVAIAATLCLVGVAFILWNAGLFTPAYRIQMYAPESGGLAPGSQVRLNGMPAGTVVAVNPAAAPATPARMVQIILQIPKRYQGYVRSDSTASINSAGPLGPRVVNIHGTSGGSQIEPGGEINFEPTHEPTAKDFVDALSKRNGCSDGEKHESSDSASAH